MIMVSLTEIANCFTVGLVNGSEKCLVCNGGYYLNADGCFPLFCEKIIENCIECDPANTSRCARCISAEYSVRDGICVSSRLYLNGESQPALVGAFDTLHITAYDETSNRLIRTCRPDLFRFENTCVQECDVYDLERKICRQSSTDTEYSTDGVVCWSGYEMSANGIKCKPSKCYWHETLKNGAIRRVEGCEKANSTCVEAEEYFICHKEDSAAEEACRYQIDSNGRCINYERRMWVAFSLFVVSFIMCLVILLTALVLKAKEVKE